MQQTRKKVLLEHLVVRKLGGGGGGHGAAGGELKQGELDDILRFGAQVGQRPAGVQTASAHVKRPPQDGRWWAIHFIGIGNICYQSPSTSTEP